MLEDMGHSCLIHLISDGRDKIHLILPHPTFRCNSLTDVCDNTIVGYILRGNVSFFQNKIQEEMRLRTLVTFASPVPYCVPACNTPFL